MYWKGIFFFLSFTFLFSENDVTSTLTTDNREVISLSLFLLIIILFTNRTFFFKTFEDYFCCQNHISATQWRYAYYYILFVHFTKLINKSKHLYCFWCLSYFWLVNVGHKHILLIPLLFLNCIAFLLILLSLSLLFVLLLRMHPCGSLKGCPIIVAQLLLMVTFLSL